MHNILQRPYAESLIQSYIELGYTALENGHFRIAYKMFRAAFNEPSNKAQKQKHQVRLLLLQAQAHVGLKQFYKAKLVYIRALSYHRKAVSKPDMAATNILFELAKITARQGIFRQAWQFILQAKETYVQAEDKHQTDFVAALQELDEIFASRGRIGECSKIRELVQTNL
ncbi:MAG: hypothetical protein K2W82_16600 [Candidatus Obscuribacterales bacterium]|nr:hypothetical protein [Candidatus Obscuribacterales bacterium]